MVLKVDGTDVNVHSAGSPYRQYTTNGTNWPSAGSRWVNIEPTLGKRLVLAGKKLRHGPNAGSMLGHRLRRCPNINPPVDSVLFLYDWL